MNNHRHLEAYYAVSGSGMIMHTCNPRLHPPQLIFVINHAEDGALLFEDRLGQETGGFNGGYGYCMGPAVCGVGSVLAAATASIVNCWR